MNDFTGFSFNGIHSSQLGIHRVSNGDRYTELLQPEIEDIYNPIPGSDGNHYFGSHYRTKPITITIAYDSITEEQFRHIVRLFSTKQVCSLIFDERPYKVYAAKIAQPIQLDYICFDESKKYIELERDGVRVINRNFDEETGEVTIHREQVTPYRYDPILKERIYKGEGTIELICTYPFAREQFKVLDQYGPYNTIYNHFGEKFEYDHIFDNPAQDSIEVFFKGKNRITEYTNINEWAAASGILSYQEYNKWHIDTVLTENTNIYFKTNDIRINEHKTYYVLENGTYMAVVEPVVGNIENYYEKEQLMIPEGYNAYIPVYNPGDKEAPFFLYLPYTVFTFTDENEETKQWGKLTEQIPHDTKNVDNIVINSSNHVTIIRPFEAKSPYKEESGIIFNTRNHLIEGVLFDPATNAWTTTGNLYNENILAGDFPTIKCQDWSLDWRHYSQAIFLNCATAGDARIFYNYIYY